MKHESNMTADALIARYSITRAGEQMRIPATMPGRVENWDEAFAEIKARKPEIMAALRAAKEQEAERQRAEEGARRERQRKRDAIPGLLEIEKAQAAWAKWNRAFEKSFDECGGLGVGPAPKVSVDELKKQYPAAAAYLRAENRARSGNPDIMIIGRKAANRIAENPDNYEAALADMEAELSENARKHMWD